FPLAFSFPPRLGSFGFFEFQSAAFGAILGAVPAILIGLLQRVVLRRHLILSRWWILSAASGVGLLHFLSDGFPDAKDLSIAVFASGVLVGLLQWFLLRRSMSLSAWWVLASLAGWYLGWVAGMTLLDGIGLLNLPWTPELGFQQHGLVGSVVGMAYGILTGAGLVWLLRGNRHRAARDKIHRMDAEV
ncbi:MAG: hypothetical protein HYR71_08015, partial [Chloroflexi bacterium]|nr:hypothetical protein [Chloroflexota bacterium]